MAKKEWRCWLEGHADDDVVLFADESPESAAEAAAEHFNNACEEQAKTHEEGAVWMIVREVLTGVCLEALKEGEPRSWRVELAPYEVIVLRARDTEALDA